MVLVFGGGNPVFFTSIVIIVSVSFSSISKSKLPFSFLHPFFLTPHIATLAKQEITTCSRSLCVPLSLSPSVSVRFTHSFSPEYSSSIPFHFFLYHYHFRWGQVNTAKFGGGARWCFGLESFSVSRRDPSSISQNVILRCGEAREAPPVFYFPFREAKSHGSERIVNLRSGIRYRPAWEEMENRGLF